MRYLRDVHDAEEVDRLVALLEDRGIAPYVQPIGLRRMLKRYKLFVMLDAQFEDAVALLRDPEHVVVHPLDPAAIAAIRESHGTWNLPHLDALLAWLLPLAALLVVACVVLAARA